MNSYQYHYNKFQQEALLNKYQQVPKNSTETTKNELNTVPETPTVDPNQFCGSICRIPSFWKRFGSDIIDYFVLSIIKYIIAYCAVYLIFYINIRRYNQIFVLYLNVDYTKTVEIILELFASEVIHRLIVCIYEIWCLHSRHGATIGEMLLDLQVVRADKVYHIRGQTVSVIAVTPGGCMSWKCAVIRSVTKNLIFPFLFPSLFIIDKFFGNRNAYDMLCGLVIVECVQPLRCDQSELIPIPQ